jgi:drug/metabolite transporter (DMT)-like permease
MKKALIQLHIAVFLAGFTAILGKLIGLNEGVLVWYRLLLSASILWVSLYLKKRIDIPGIMDAIRIAGVGAVISIHWVLFYGSVKYANISVAVVCLSAAGFFTSFFEPLFFKRRIILAEVLLGLLAIWGIYIIFDFHPQFQKGVIFGVLAALCSSLFPVFNKKLLMRFDPKTLTLYEMSGGLLSLTLILPVYLYHFPAAYYFPTAADWLWLIILAWVCTVVCFDLQLNSLKKLSPFTTNLSYNLEPVYGIILAFLFFHENKSLNYHFYIGVALILSAVAIQMGRVISSKSKKTRQNQLNFEIS